jgi:TM2 domain-containing membrane protein YozV
VEMANAILAAILSFFFPGIGQIYAGEMQKGIIFFVIFLILVALTYMVYYYISIIEFLFGIYAAYDAYKIASAT